MPKYLDTRGNKTPAIGICDRCRLKFPLHELLVDKDNPGLRVCANDRDEADPWKKLRGGRIDEHPLPFTRTELGEDRNDNRIANSPIGISTEDEAQFVLDEFGNWVIP